MDVKQAQRHCMMLHRFMTLHCFTEEEDLPSCQSLNSLGYDEDGWCIQIPSLKMIVWEKEFNEYMAEHKLAPLSEGSKYYGIK